MINYRRFSRRRLLPVREIELPNVFGVTQRVRNLELMSGKTSAAKSGRLPVVWSCPKHDRSGAAVPILPLPLLENCVATRGAAA